MHKAHKSINIFSYLFMLLGSEVQLKLRLSSTLSDVKLSVYSKDSIFACKKKLQVRKKYKNNLREVLKSGNSI